MITITNISKSFNIGGHQVNALTNVSLDISKGDYIAITGVSGAGKSTLMNIIGCLDTPSSGEYKLNNVAVESFDDEELSKLRNDSIGFIFQSFHLLPNKTAIENVMIPLLISGLSRRKAHKIAEERLNDVGLSSRSHHLPTELSGGQQQRVAIARALVNNPDIILADEPTGNLDSETTRDVLNVLKHLNSLGKTIIIITHEQEVANQAKKQVVVKDGKLLAPQTTD